MEFSTNILAVADLCSVQRYQFFCKTEKLSKADAQI